MRVNLCVCTFRRASLKETLNSIDAMIIPEGVTLSIVVADNDIAPSAQSIVHEFNSHSPLSTHYVHAPKQNISIARNACLEHCDGDWVGFIDDDELIDKHWLVAMQTATENSKHGIFLGPVKALYQPNHRQNWMPKGAFHDTTPTFRNGDICSGYTCNVLIRYSDPKVRAMRFDERFGRTGGEDTLMFEQLQAQGLSMTYVEGALVQEPVPDSRSSLRWLLQRRFRFGQTHARVLLEDNLSILTRVRHVTLAAGKALFCYLSALVMAFDAVKWRRWAIRGALHLGVISRMLKNKDIELYGHA
ncbi:glycosyltransferase [Vibrio astriarenae]